jgi:hypothetical protein
VKSLDVVSQCLQCGTSLNLDHVVPPRFGLVTIACGECGHQHLLSPLEIEHARNDMQMEAAPRQGRFGIWLRRFIVS